MTVKKAISVLIAAAAVAATVACRSGGAPSVVAYVSEDQVFSEPILKDFERDTGITVKAVFDTEEAKSTGVVNRLLAEADNPQADVYWANEPIRAESLRQRGVSTPYRSPNAAGIPDTFKDPEGHWTGFSARARVLVVHKEATEKPDSILAYTDPRWKGKSVIANPLFGTTTAAIAALFTVWEQQHTETFLNQMKGNGVKVATSNGESADLVASGEFIFALVDSDDGVSRMRQGKPVEMVYPDQNEGGLGVFVVPTLCCWSTAAPIPRTAKN
jgi:iron(III) transport system substrate-binding protein